MSTREFNLLLVNIYDSLRPAAYRLTQDSEEAHDLLQETMTKALKNKDKFKQGTNLRAWLYTIMRNTYITYYHRVKKRSSVLDTSDKLTLVAPESLVQTNDGVASLVLKDIEEALLQLKVKYRTPFEMYCLGYKYHEIAELLALPIGTVKNHIHVARKELKKLLTGYTPASS